MKISYDDIESAFLFVSMQPMFGNQALLSTKTGEIFYISEYGDSDELPDDIEESEDYIEIPHKNELNLGKRLVFDFVSERIPEESDKVSQIFRRKGAYSWYKNFLERLGLLDEWYKFEDTHQNKALRKWCSDNNIEVFG
jgi:hypothetical protein